jgi:hypothetical protein
MLLSKLFGWFAHTEAAEKKRLMTLSEQKKQQVMSSAILVAWLLNI